MKKAILGFAAAAMIAGTALTPTPASAFVFFLFPAVMMAKKDANFKAVNPYDKPVRIARHSRRHRM